MATPFEHSVTLPSSLQLLMQPGARARPDPSQTVNRLALQHTMSLNAGGGYGTYGTGYSDRYTQTNGYSTAVAVAAKPFLNAARGSKYKVLQLARTVKKSAGVGHYSRDEEYEPADPDHPLCRILANPNGKRGGWSMAREIAYLALQYHLTGDAPAWCVPNEAGKPVQFYALTSATVQLQLPPGASPAYPKGAYRVTPYAGGGSFGLAGGLYAGAILPAEEVERLIDEDPWSRGIGRSRLQVGNRWIDILDAISRSRWAFFDKGPQLGLMIVIPGAGEEVVQTLNKSITAKHGGADNAGNRIVVMGGGGMEAKVGIHPLSMTSEEMGFLESHGQALEDVLALFGVPKPVACYPDSSNYATFYAAKQQFYDSTLLPFFLRLSDFLTTALAEPWSDEPGQYKIEAEPPPVGDVEMDEQKFQSDQQSGLLTWNQCLHRRDLPTVGPEGEVPAPMYLAKMQAQLQQQFAPPPTPGAPAGGDEQPDGGADPLSGLLGGKGGEEQPDDSEEGTQDAVTGAALSALGVPEDDGTGDESDNGDDTYQKAGVPVSKPGGAVKRQEGQKWQVNGQWYTKKNGQIVKTGDPSKAGQKPGAGGTAAGAPTHRALQAAVPANGAASPNHDALAAKLLNGRPSLNLLGPDLKAHKISDGASVKAFLDKGGKLPTEAAMEAAKAVRAPGPVAQKTLATAGQWAAQQADKHADKVAAHFGITRERAHALLTHAIQEVAKHAAKNGGAAPAVTIRDKRSGKTATLAPTKKPSGPTAGAPPRPANPDAKGSRPPVAKAMSALSGPDGGTLVAPSAVGKSKRKRRVAACVARVLKSLEAGE